MFESTASKSGSSNSCPSFRQCAFISSYVIPVSFFGGPTGFRESRLDPHPEEYRDPESPPLLPPKRSPPPTSQSVPNPPPNIPPPNPPVPRVFCPSMSDIYCTVFRCPDGLYRIVEW